MVPCLVGLKEAPSLCRALIEARAPHSGDVHYLWGSKVEGKLYLHPVACLERIRDFKLPLVQGTFNEGAAAARCTLDKKLLLTPFLLDNSIKNRPASHISD
jgi:hypothetical protein